MNTNIFECAVSYDKLTAKLSKYLDNNNFTNNVNVIIDLNEIFRKVFKRLDLQSIDPNELVESVVPDIMNLIGHYRYYFSNNLKYSTYYILYSEKECKQFIDLDANYKSHIYDKYHNGEIGNYCKAFLNYLKPLFSNTPHCNYFDTSTYDEKIFASCILKNNEKDLNIILSNDYTFATLLSDNCIMFDCKGYDTNLITKNTLISVITEGKYRFSNNMVPLMLSLSGYDKYSINGITGYKYVKACKLIDKLIKSEKITDYRYYYIDFKSFDLPVITNNLTIISKNFNIFEPTMIRLEAENKLLDICKNTYTVSYRNQFEDINNEYFSLNPINIDKLFVSEV